MCRHLSGNPPAYEGHCLLRQIDNPAPEARDRRLRCTPIRSMLVSFPIHRVADNPWIRADDVALRIPSAWFALPVFPIALAWPHRRHLAGTTGRGSARLPR
jgi:hypothetical protein